MSGTSSTQADKLWQTYHHIAWVKSRGKDWHGNTWDQETYGQPAEAVELENQLEELAKEKDYDFTDPAYKELADQRTAVLEGSTDFKPFQCDTAQCFAGWYATLHAPKGTEFTSGGDILLPGDDERIGVDEYTVRDSGLDSEDADCLFEAHNSLEAIADMLTDYTGKDRR